MPESEQPFLTAPLFSHHSESTQNNKSRIIKKNKKKLYIVLSLDWSKYAHSTKNNEIRKKHEIYIRTQPIPKILKISLHMRIKHVLSTLL